MQHGVPPMGYSLSQTFPTWVLPVGCSFSRTAPARALFLGCSRSGMECSSWGPPRDCSSYQKTCSCLGGSSQATAPSRSLFQCRLSTGCTFLQRTSTCSSVGSSMGCGWIYAPPWTSMGCRWTTCVTVAFNMGCGGIYASSTGARSCHLLH